MPLPILQPSTKLETQIRGDVIIDDSAIIADGVILNASEGSKIIIRAGACLGMGTIINAYQGNVEIKESVILGSGTLIFGDCIINSQASLGASVTVYNTSVEARRVIPAGTVIGDRSRKLDLSPVEETETNPPEKNDDRTESTPINGKNDHHSQPSHNQSSNKFVNPYSQYKITCPPLPDNSKKNEEKKTETVADKSVEDSNEIKQPQQEETNYSSIGDIPQKPEETETKEPEKTPIVEEIDVNESHSHSDIDNKPKDHNTNGLTGNDPRNNENLPRKNDSVVGKVYINKLLYTLFPHKN